MRIGIVSDTHDNVDAVERAVEHFEAAGVDAVVHCGDVVAPFSATPFERDEWEFHAVRGNNDGEWNLQAAIEAFGTYHGEIAELTLDGTDLAVYHGTGMPIVRALVERGEYDYVPHGHTHQRAHEEGDTVRINPGGISIPPAPEPLHVAVLDTDAGEVAFERIEDKD